MNSRARALPLVAAWFASCLAARAGAEPPQSDGEGSPAAPSSAAPASGEAELEAARRAFRATPDGPAAERVGLAAAAAQLHREAAEHFAIAVSLTPAAAAADRERLQAALKAAKAHVATLVIKLAPEVPATLVVDGTPVGLAPLKLPLYLEPGEHELAALADDRRFVSVRVGLTANETFTITLREAPAGASDGPASRPVWPGIVTGALGAAALVTGVATLIVSFAREDDANALAGSMGACDLDQLDDDCQRLAALVSDRNTLRNASTVAFVASGVLAAATLGYLFIPLPEGDGPPKTSLTLRASASGSYAGLSVMGTFQ